MSDQRRLLVLRAIVEDYVRTREPVGSKAIVDRHNLSVSSATVRNDMVALEEEGLITAPHTSAGRIPTDKGYRLFVNELSEVKPLSDPEKRAIATLLDGEGDLEDVLERTVRALAQLTNQVAVLQYPSPHSAKVRHVEFVLVAPHQVLVVLILDSGKVEQGVFDAGQVLDDVALSQVRATFLSFLSMAPVATVPAMITAAAETLDPSLTAVGNALSEALLVLVRSSLEERVLVAGTANLARSNVDFPSSIGPVLDALEEHMVMLRLLSEMAHDAHGLGVSIGRENRTDSLADASVVVSNYGSSATAKLGVVGPIRMDYSNTMTAVRAVARYLTKILSGT